MTTIGLCMIVKNEAHVIVRCLASVRPLIDYVLVVDTGSTDHTEALVNKFLSEEGIPGEVVSESWRDFAHNRSSALARLRTRTDIDYALVMDADDVMVLPDGFDVASFKHGLTQDFYHVEIRYEPIRFWRAQLMRNRIEFRYRGVLHEFVVGPPTVTSSGTTSGLYIREGADGARSRSSEKHLDDVRTLERALETETNEFIRARYVFYLAQTWRNAGEYEKALQLYLRRATLGQFQAEVFVSLYRAAQLKEELGYHAGEVVGSYLNAYEADPVRAESLHGAMDYCRRRGKHHQGYLIGKQAVTMTEPPGALFSEPWIYDYGLLEEFSVAAFHSGHFQECITAINKLLEEGKIPQEAHERLRQNAQEARERLKARQ